MASSKRPQGENYLTGQFLIAMPGLADARFARSVVFMAEHSDKGALGLIVNKLSDKIRFDELLPQLGIAVSRSHGARREAPVYFGGPVESGRGFVLHSADYESPEGTFCFGEDIRLTSSLDVMRAIAEGRGPKRMLVVFGYAGWGPGQLEAEIAANGWLNSPADAELLFDADLESKWRRAIAKIGVDVSMLSSRAGRA